MAYARWTEPAYQSWRRRSFKQALDVAAVAEATPYALRYSFASLLVHDGRSVIYVARQLGHDARLTLTRDGHVKTSSRTSRTFPRKRRSGKRVFSLGSPRPRGRPEKGRWS